VQVKWWISNLPIYAIFGFTPQVLEAKFERKMKMQAIKQRISWLVGLAFPKILRLVAQSKPLPSNGK